MTIGRPHISRSINTWGLISAQFYRRSCVKLGISCNQIDGTRIGNQHAPEYTRGYRQALDLESVYCRTNGLVYINNCK